jgi:hypothetical protein
MVAPYPRIGGEQLLLWLTIISCPEFMLAPLLLLQVAAIGGLWRDVGRLPEPQLAQLIRQDEIDILVELTGGQNDSSGMDKRVMTSYLCCTSGVDMFMVPCCT